MINLDSRLQEASVGALEFFEASEAHQVLSRALEKGTAPITAAPESTSLEADAAETHSAHREAASLDPIIRVQNRLAIPISPDISASSASTERGAAKHHAASSQVKVQAPPWLIGMAPSFYKDISEVDRKLQGRLLQIIADLARQHLQPHGDTLKPFSGPYKPCWRYRIGDHRLVFLPDASRASITLLAFVSRGSVYED